MKQLAGCVAVVTGAGSGIGRETARLLAVKGAKVAVLGRELDTVEETAVQIRTAGGTAAAFGADVSKRGDVDAAAVGIRAKLGPPAILVNNAGIMLTLQPMSEVPYEHFELAVSTNTYGVVNCTYAFLPDILAQPEGSIVNVSSLVGLMGMTHQVPYTMSKFAVRGFSEALRMELLESRVRVSTVYPGFIDTNIIDNSPTLDDAEKAQLKKQVASRRQTSPVTVARKIVKVIRRGRARVLVAPETYMTDLMARLMPGHADQTLQPLMKKLQEAGTVKISGKDN